MIVAAKLLLVGFAAGSVMSPPSAPYGIGWADATCPLAGRTLSEDVYTRTYVRSCTWTWDAGKETRMQLAQGLDDGPATNVYIHFNARSASTAAGRRSPYDARPGDAAGVSPA